MTIQEEAQALIEKETRGEQVYQMKWRLEKKAKLEKEIVQLVEEMAKIEVAPLPTSMSCGNNSLVVSSGYGTVGSWITTPSTL